MTVTRGQDPSTHPAGGGAAPRRRVAAVVGGLVLVVALATVGLWVAGTAATGPSAGQREAYVEQVQAGWLAGGERMRDLPAPLVGGPLDAGWTEDELVEAGGLVCDGVGQWGLVARYPDHVGVFSAQVVVEAAQQHLC
ncbi:MULTISPECIES: hypothetical protein [Pseudonocardia]|uniref:Uncharacterized protein n=2 Tax=Pseudonocardia TaxID=1847 RepID=A0A1Y2N676_PSEAH|nr:MULTISPECIES: hypothetical protein [Pseudonocardia]OSY42964.1 hypothetical protein BG845_01206 [Pseudonocardia autotrophica]TDN77540.1 hypothetical protein C8E95_6788 [Pseudonocardia autotrophica]BBG01568.1 hypothetical protein Pdca_27770 [Pseudonocardia autotrophica]GEC29083.1 hypothetical protein PSA01_61120 [Pseudonocardia saturnea]